MPLLLLIVCVCGALGMRAGEDPAARFRWFRNVRVPEGVVVDEAVRARAIATERRMQRSKVDAGVQEVQPVWTFSGPASVAGRIKTILTHPSDPDALWVGAAGGGVWYSSNGGSSWVPRMDDENAIAMGSLAMDPADARVIYAGTGEQVTNANIFLGAGLLRSADAGISWTTVGLGDVGAFSRVVCTSSTRIVCAAMNANGGVYESTDRGTTWTRRLDAQVYDLDVCASDSNEWWAAIPDSGIMYTNDAGRTWQRRMQGVGGRIGRASIRQSTRDPRVLYMLAEVDDLASIWKTTDRGITWTKRFQGDACFFAGTCRTEDSQGFYDNVLCISHASDDVVFAGGIDLWRTDDGGVTWQNVTKGYADGNGNNAVHVDQHAIAVAADPRIVYLGNDGGMWRSDDGGVTFAAVNAGLHVTQFYGFDHAPDVRDRMYGGTQDQGTMGTEATGAVWDSIYAGDGMTTVISHTLPQYVYGNLPYGNIFRFDRTAPDFRFVMTGIDIGERAIWVAPLAMSPVDDASLVCGRRRVYRTWTRGDAWEPISPSFLGSVSSLTFSAADAERLWAGSDRGEVMTSSNGGETWTMIDRTRLPGRFISGIATPPDDANVAWLCYAAYGVPGVWQTTDAGNTWTDRSTGLPDVPCNAIVTHPDDAAILYVATDIGVYVTYDAGRLWMPYGVGLPRSPALELRVQPTFDLLRVATHGRGIWETSLTRTQPSDPLISTPSGGEVVTGRTTMTVAWSGVDGPASIDYSVNDGATWEPVARDVAGRAVRWRVPNWPTSQARIRVTSQTTPTQQVVSRTFTIARVTRGSVLQTRACAWRCYGLAHDGRNGLWTTDLNAPRLLKLDATTLELERIVPLDAAAGDSLFMDLTIDRSNGTIYLHRLDNVEGSGATIVVVDTTGRVLRTMPSPARRYGTGIELVGPDLVAIERDGLPPRIFTMDPATADVRTEHANPYRSAFGPRSICFDGGTEIVMAAPWFLGGERRLTASYLVAIDTASYEFETRRMAVTTRAGVINIRGVERDPADSTYFISDVNGTIHRIAGFDYPEPPVTSVDDDVQGAVRITVVPQPVWDHATLTVPASDVGRRLEIEVRDVLGRIVVPATTAWQDAGSDLPVRISMRTVPSGTYVIIVRAEAHIVATASAVKS